MVTSLLKYQIMISYAYIPSSTQHSFKIPESVAVSEGSRGRNIETVNQ